MRKSGIFAAAALCGFSVALFGQSDIYCSVYRDTEIVQTNVLLPGASVVPRFEVFYFEDSHTGVWTYSRIVVTQKTMAVAEAGAMTGMVGVSLGDTKFSGTISSNTVDSRSMSLVADNQAAAYVGGIWAR